MKLGVIADVHSNLEALTAIMEALAEAGVDRIVCAGDVVGYGPDPNECIALLRQQRVVCVMGNHDQLICHHRAGGADILPEALEAIVWSRRVLGQTALRWLRSLPMSTTVGGVHFVHASHALWPAWTYVIDERAALENFLFQPGRLTFNGHSHVPLLVSFRPREKPKVLRLRNMLLPRGRRLLVGVGAVGQPRDGDSRACCVVFDMDRQHLRLLRRTYDIHRTQSKIRRAHLPEMLASRLAEGC